MRAKRGWILVSIVGLVATLGIIERLQAFRALAERHAKERSKLERLARMRADNETLARMVERMPTISSADLAQAQSDLLRIRSELTDETRRLAAATSAKVEPFSPGSIVAPADWQNAGRATSEAALQTLLWAGAGGDVAELAAQLQLSPTARAALRAAIADLPAAVRQKYGTPEELIAAATIPDISIAPVRVRTWDYGNVEQTERSVQMEVYTAADPKLVGLKFARSETGWSLVVPDAVVTHYLTCFKGGE